MMPIGSEGCGVSGRHAEQSTQRCKFVDLPESGRNAVRCSCAIVESSQVHQKLPGARRSIVKYYGRVWEPPKPQGGSRKVGARPRRKLHFPDVVPCCCRSQGSKRYSKSTLWDDWFSRLLFSSFYTTPILSMSNLIP
jgi:hypothetical protein